MPGEVEIIESTLRDYVTSGGTKSISVRRLRQQIRVVSLDRLLDILHTIQRSYRNGSVIQWAAIRGHLDVIECITESVFGHHFDLLQIQNWWGNTVMHSAAISGHIETIEYVLNNIPGECQVGLLRTRTKDGETAIHYAAENGQVSVIECILNHFPSSNSSDILKQETKDGRTVIHCAAENDESEALEFLLNNLPVDDGTDLLRKQDRNGYTALMYAARYGYITSIQCIYNFLPKNQWFNIATLTNKDGKTAKELAAEQPHEDVVSFLRKNVRPPVAAKRRKVVPKNFPPTEPEAIPLQINYIAKIEQLESTKQKVNQKKIECEKVETESAKRIEKLDETIAVKSEELTQVTEGWEEQKYKCRTLENKLWETKKELKKRDEEIEHLRALTLTLANTTQTLASTNKTLIEREGEAEKLEWEKNQLKQELEHTSKDLDVAKKDLEDYDKRLEELEKETQGATKERAFLEKKREDCRQKVEKLVEKEIELKERVDECKSRLEKMDRWEIAGGGSASGGVNTDDLTRAPPLNVTFKAEQPEPESEQEVGYSDDEIEMADHDEEVDKDAELIDGAEALLVSTDKVMGDEKEAEIKDVSPNEYQLVPAKEIEINADYECPSIAVDEIAQVWKCIKCGSYEVEKMIPKRPDSSSD